MDLDAFLQAMSDMYAPFPGIVAGWKCYVGRLKEMDPPLVRPMFEQLDPPLEVVAASEQIGFECPIPFDDVEAALRRPDGTIAPMPVLREEESIDLRATAVR